MKIVVAQLGARQHYEIPKMCAVSGELARFYTDYWADIPVLIKTQVKRIGHPGINRFLGRVNSTIPSKLVQSYPIAASLWAWRLRKARGRYAQYAVHEEWGKEFAVRVARNLDHDEHTTFFGFSSASLEALIHERRAGRFAVLDEIAPTHLEEEILAEESKRFPDWEAEGGPIPTSFLARLEEEWDTADRIMVNSDWSKRALMIRGVPENKIFIVPISYLSVNKNIQRDSNMRPLRVLWLGTLCLRKGFQYAIEAARRLEGSPVSFTFAGPADINLHNLSWPKNCRYIGQVPRINVNKLWEMHDIFLLPTLSDGFAITQIEAMANGLPVIATHNCGDVVEDGLSGLRIEARSPEAIVTAIQRFLDGEIDFCNASTHALARASDFTPEKIWKILHQVLTPPSL